MLSKKDRLLLLIKHFGKENNSEFARYLGVSPQTISSWLSRNTFDIDLVYAKCSNISADWLLGGDEEIFRRADGEPNAAQAEPTIIYRDNPDKDEIIELQRDQIKLLKEKLNGDFLGGAAFTGVIPPTASSAHAASHEIRPVTKMQRKPQKQTT